MTSSFTTNKQIEKPAYQDYASDPTGWTVPINTDWDIVDKAFGGTVSIALTNVNVNLTTSQCQNVHIKFTGALSSNVTIYFPATISGFFIVDNVTTGGYTVVLANAGGSPGFTVAAVQNANTFVWVDQSTSSVYLADNAPVTGGTGINVAGSVISLQTPVAVANGGTGATTYTAGQLLIGNNAGGLTPATLTAGSNINITNGNGAITIAAVGSAGGVTTFNAGTTGFTPNTDTAGPITLGGTLNVANGGTGLSTMTAANRALYSTSASAITAGTLPVAAGGTGAVTLTGYVKGTGTTAMTASATIPTSDLTGTLGVANGGTGAATLTGYVKGSGTSAMTASATIPTSDLTGTLGVSNGGTGATTLTGYVKGTGTTAMTASASIPGSDVTGAYTSSAMTLATSRLLGRTTAGSGSVEEISIGSGLTLSAGQLSASASGVSSLSFGTTGLTPSTAQTGAITVAGTLATGNGGTGLTTFTAANRAIYSTSSSALTAGTLPVAAGGTGGTSQSTARSGIGAAASGANSDITSLTGLTTALSVAQGGTGATTTGGIRTQIGLATNSAVQFASLDVGDTTPFTGAALASAHAADWAVEAYSATSSSTGYGAIIARVNNTGNPLTSFYYNSASTIVGTITTNGSGVTYGTSSDYRLKENIFNFSDGLSKLKALRPVTYTWKGNPSLGTVTGFIAHEVQAVIPQAVVGEKDAVNVDGSIKPQNIDYSMLVPVLVSAVKELTARIEALEAKLP